jgi:hypothetical protein
MGHLLWALDSGYRPKILGPYFLPLAMRLPADKKIRIVLREGAKGTNEAYQIAPNVSILCLDALRQKGLATARTAKVRFSETPQQRCEQSMEEYS